MCIVPTEMQRDFDTASDAYAKEDIIRVIDWYAKQHRLDPLLLRAVIAAESNFRVDARSHKGALGLMQLMSSTVEQYQVEDPFDPLQNIRAGSNRLRHLLRLYRGQVMPALAAYNAGVHRVKGSRLPRIRETRRYVQKVLRQYRDLHQKQTMQSQTTPGHARVVSAHQRGPGRVAHVVTSRSTTPTAPEE